MNFTKKERRLIAHLLEMASNEFANHGCNDLDKDIFKGWSEDEIEALRKEYCEHNQLEYHSGAYIPDWGLMKYYSEKMVQ